MQPQETKQILDFIAASDNRNVSEQTYGAWHLLLENLSFSMCREAAVMALKDPEIRWVEPKHILAKVSKIIDTEQANIRREAALAPKVESKGAPMPVCKHNKGLLYCDPCCHDAAVKKGLIPDTPYKKKISLN
jgi:hypothetical protein